MAHTCPDCGQICRCNGDIADMDTGDWSPEANACTCCPPDFDDDDECDSIEQPNKDTDHE